MKVHNEQEFTELYNQWLKDSGTGSKRGRSKEVSDISQVHFEDGREVMDFFNRYVRKQILIQMMDLDAQSGLYKNG